MRQGKRMYVADRRAMLITVAAVAFALITVGVVFRMRRNPSEERWRQAAVLIADGRRTEAEAVLQAIILEDPTSEYAARARELLFGSRDHKTGSPAERLFREARSFYPLGSGSRSDLEEAVKRYMAVADSYSTEPIARDALYDAAQCYDHMGDPDRAVGLWKRFLASYPSDGRAPEVLYALGYIHVSHYNMRDEGTRYFEELLSRYPNSSSAEAAKVFIDGAKPASAEIPSGTPSIMTEPGRL